MSRPARVLVLGAPGAGRTETACRLIEAWTSGPGAPARLPQLSQELRLRGLAREDPGAPPGSCTTRQILDAVLRRRERSPQAPDDRSLYVALPGDRLVEVVDVSGARFLRALPDAEAVHPLRALERSADAAVLVLPAARWADPSGQAVDRTERDRLDKALERLTERSARVGGRMPLALVVTGTEALPTERPALEALRARAAGGAFSPEVCALGPRPRPGELSTVVRLLHHAFSRPRGRLQRLARFFVVLVGVALVGAALVTLAGWLDLRRFTGGQAAADPEAERAFLDSALRARARWRWLPPVGWIGEGALGRSIAQRARQLAARLEREHPALREPRAACALTVGTYRTARQALAVAAGVLGGGRYAARLSLLGEKERIAAMPAAGAETLAAWEELYRTVQSRALQGEVVAPRLAAVLARLAERAEKEALAAQAFPAMLGPVRAMQRAHPPLADAAFDRAQGRVWTAALGRVLAGLPKLASDPAARLAALLAAWRAAPEPPPRSVRVALGREAGEAALRALRKAPLPPPLAKALGETLGPAAWSAVLALVPKAYAALAKATGRPDDGPPQLAALRRLLRLVPEDRIEPRARAPLARLRAHLDHLFGFERYALKIVDVEVSKALWTMWDGYDLVVEIGTKRSEARRRGPFENQLYRDLSGEWLFGPGELRWRAWDRIWIKVTDDERPVGFQIEDKGEAGPFGLHRLAGTTQDPGGHGRIHLQVDPAPPAPFDFSTWPAPTDRPR